MNRKNNGQIDVIVEARLSSTRLPGKVLLPVIGRPLLEIMIERLRRIKNIANIIIATTVNPADNIIVKLADRLGIGCFRGSEEDVFVRVVKAAQQYGTDVIVEITGDDPLVDPEISSQVVELFMENEGKIDVACNDIEPGFPLGFYTRAFKRQLLESVERLTNNPVDRENVESYFYNRLNEFRFSNIAAKGIYYRPDIRLTLDTNEDYQVIKHVFESLYPKNPEFSLRDIIDFLDANPKIRELNKEVKQRKFIYG